MPLCKHNCGTELTWVWETEGLREYGKWVPYGSDGQPHRCAEGLAAYRAGKAVERHDPAPSEVGYEPPNVKLPYNAPQPRTEVQELRHAVQRLARAVELLTEAVQELSARELASTR